MATSRNPDYGKITEASIERYRGRIGIANPGVPAWYREAHPDTMRHFAWSFGDGNGLFSEPDYGLKTRWGSMIGSPFYVANLCEPVAEPIPADVRERTKGALAGLHEFHAGSEYFFYRPIVPGDRAFSRRILIDVQERESTFGGGRSVLHEDEETMENMHGQPILKQRMSYFHTERKAASEGGKEKTQNVPSYSPEDIEAIEAAILSETVRGSEPRYWDDVEVGDVLPTLTKGPMTITDIIAGHIGRGPGHMAWGPLGLGVQSRQHRPGFYTRNEYGAWDVVQRVHWDSEFARSIGAARIYDYGTMRMNWLTQFLTNWMGDDAWINRFRCEFRKFNYVGDASFITGEIVKKSDDGTVEIKFTCNNQAGEVTAPGDATVALPRRNKPVPELPTPPTDWYPIRQS
jgi:acyl dehydratase